MAKTHTPKSKSRAKSQDAVLNTDDNQINEQSLGTSLTEEFEQEIERLTILRFQLHKQLMNIMQYLTGYEDVGIDSDNNRSSKMALYQLNILIEATSNAAEYVVQLPQTNFIQELHTILQMIRQNLEITRIQTENAIEDGECDESIIRYIRETVLQSYKEAKNPLNQMAAELMTIELTRELREATKILKQALAPEEIEYVSREKSGKPAETSGGDEKREPLSDNQAAIYELLKELPEHKAMTGKEILKKLEGKGIIIDQSTLTKNIIPALRPYGVKNKRGAGYYISK